MVNESVKTILLVEDELLIAMAKQHELERFGYNTMHAMTGSEAVCKVKKNKNIDMVLMDIDLGRGIDGIEAAELILEYMHIPILFVSSRSESEIIEKTGKIGAYGYVVKSAGIKVLHSSIQAAFKIFDDGLAAECKTTFES